MVAVEVECRRELPRAPPLSMLLVPVNATIKRVSS